MDPCRIAFEEDAVDRGLPTGRVRGEYRDVRTVAAWTRWQKAWHAALDWHGETVGELRTERDALREELQELRGTCV